MKFENHDSLFLDTTFHNLKSESDYYSRRNVLPTFEGIFPVVIPVLSYTPACFDIPMYKIFVCSLAEFLYEGPVFLGENSFVTHSEVKRGTQTWQ